MVTEHQKKHLIASIQSANNDSVYDIVNIKKRAENENVYVKDFQDYLNNIKVKAQAILDSGVWPSEVKKEHEIHAYLDLNKTFRKFDESDK